ncbi:PAN2-PAN3 deadenylation complex catalytic subunit PAN2 [Spea bombifrons]|uniref:PAN2-PAN3 deadenylation complex catalytic subunit PAN2 n=1 Tax=Spea bombifrons TaxID=233779 RepID=UPI00234A26C1|nr:PAN2-PAN3 deadenylation complex catalytic subunit PAN2 [Spea bombifrons]
MHVIMNFDSLDPALAEYAPALHAPLDPVLDPHLNPNLLQPVELDHDGVGLDGLSVQDNVGLMDGIYSELHSAVSEVGVPISSAHFDVHEEMLWVGNHGGHATSFFSPALERYSSFQVHASNDIRQIQSLESGIMFLTKNNLKYMTRGGLIIFDYLMDESVDNHSLLLTDNSTLLMGGMQSHVIQMDLNTVQETQRYTTEVPGITVMRQSNRFFFCGHSSGKLSLRDLRTFNVEHEFDAYSGSLSDFDVHGNLVVTCGFSSRMNVLTCDRFLKVYDLRMMRAITPLQVHVDPLFLRFVPTYTSRLAIISQRGQCQFCEPTGLASPADIFHVSTVSQAIMSFDVSSSKQVFAFGDSDGCVHLWSATPDATFNTYSRDSEFALPCMVDNLPHLDWTQDLLPLSLIPMPLINETLLSDWPAANCTPAPRRAPPVDPEILRNMKQVGFIGYSPNPRTKLRNQVPYQLDSEYDNFNQVPESPIGREEEPHLYMVPKKYRKVTIKYSKLGLEDFDFKHYNKTLFAGLEPHIPNAYCNCMIQVMYLLEPVRRLVQNHLCQKEFCLSCELGFLFHMLDLSRGDPCQASNFLRAFRTIPEAAALGLILADSDEATGKMNIGRLIQSWCRFLLTQLHQETQELEGPQAYRGAGNTSSFASPGGSVIGQLFGCEVENCSMCRCGKETVRVSTTLLFTLYYPDLHNNDKAPQDTEFVEVLRRSICLEQNTQAWCENCEKYQPTVQTRNIRCLPDVLVINCEVNSSKEAEFWRVQAEYAFKKALRKAELMFPPPPPPPPKEPSIGQWGEPGPDASAPFIPSVEELRNVWIPYSLKMKLSKNKELEVLNCTEAEEPSQSEEDTDEATNVYDLMATVVHILDPRTGGSLVAHIKVGETYHQRKEGVTHQQWYLFNDFLIEPVDKCEAAQFDMSWKVPTILFYAKRNLNSKYNLTIKNPIEASVLLAEASLARKQRKCHATFIPLLLNEMPQAGELVGLDAEFVTLNQEEAELRSDGTKSTIKPSQMSVARITCVRGQGPNEGVPFIDDYISTQEQVVDYLTQYSGIKPGDLDAKISSKHLTTLKSTYLKLRFLIDVGVKFVGHGLQKDFRVINLMVPKDQVIDTVYLFHIPRKRMISLRYLAWYFLDLKIQGETHDSIEDARTALQLYRKYLELSRNGTEPENFRKVLKGLYEKGRKMDWKVPEPENQNSPKNAPVYSAMMGL